MKKTVSNKFILQAVLLGASLCVALPGNAQRTLTLDSCRALALGNNKTLGMSRVNRGMAEDVRKAARTNYLPKLDAVGTYQLSSREISLLNNSQKDMLNNLGTNIASQLPSELAGAASQIAPTMTSALNEAGQSIRKAFRTNNRNLFGADVVVRQPVYMGGAIKAENKAADINISMADNNIDLTTQNTLYKVDQAYWQVVSLVQKQVLAGQYLDLVRKLHDDVAKMLAQGVATKSDELRVAVRVNEAEMAQTQVDDGVVLSKMNLCQICGLDLNTDIRLVDEASPQPSTMGKGTITMEGRGEARPELRLLENTVSLSRQNTIITRAAFLPQVLATGGYLLSNPNVLNGYRNTFSGLFHVGVTLRVPIWNWGEGRHKVRASKAATQMARLELEDMREKIDLQVQQADFRMDEAYKRLNMATSNLTSAEENLRCANVGFKEGVMQTTDVMEAQTAWQAAQTQKIDAEIEVRMAHVNLRKALGTLKR